MFGSPEGRADTSTSVHDRTGQRGLVLPFVIVLLLGLSASAWDAVPLTRGRQVFQPTAWVPSVWIALPLRPVWVGLLVWLCVPMMPAAFAPAGSRGRLYVSHLRLVSFSYVPFVVGTVLLTLFGCLDWANSAGIALWWACWFLAGGIALTQGRRRAGMSWQKSILLAVAIFLSCVVPMLVVSLSQHLWLVRFLMDRKA